MSGADPGAGDALGASGFRAPPEAYERHVGRYGAALSAALINLAGVAAGDRALDVGCGPGALTAALAERTGPAGMVAAVEPSEVFADACRRRAPAARVVAGRAEALPFPDGSFDVTLSQLVLNFADDAVAAAREMRRVTRTGGAVAACVWDYAHGMTLLRAFWDAAREVAPESAERADEGAVMPWCREGDLAALWESAGLRDVRPAAIRAGAAYDGFDDLWAPFAAGVGPSGAWCVSLPPDRRHALAAALRRRLGAGDGHFVLAARAWAVTGTA